MSGTMLIAGDRAANMTEYDKVLILMELVSQWRQMLNKEISNKIISARANCVWVPLGMGGVLENHRQPV